MLEIMDAIYEEAVMAIALGTGAAVVAYFKGFKEHRKICVKL